SSSAVGFWEIIRTISFALSTLLLSGTSVSSQNPNQKLLRKDCVILPLSPSAAATLRRSELVKKCEVIPIILWWAECREACKAGYIRGRMLLTARVSLKGEIFPVGRPGKLSLDVVGRNLRICHDLASHMWAATQVPNCLSKHY